MGAHRSYRAGLVCRGREDRCPEVEAALGERRPEVTVVNADTARFTTGDPITTTAGEVAEVRHLASYIPVVAVHMKAINHYILTRSELRDLLDRENLSQRLHIPADGERMEF